VGVVPHRLRQGDPTQEIAHSSIFGPLEHEVPMNRHQLIRKNAAWIADKPSSSGGSVRRRFSRHDCSVQRDWGMRRDAGRLCKPEETQSSSAEVPLDKGYLGRQRLPAKAVRPWWRRSSADFGSPRTIFHQITGHWRHALKNLDPGVGARFGRMNHKYLKQAYQPPSDYFGVSTRVTY